LISQIFDGLAHAASTAAADADRSDHARRGEQRCREPQERIIAGMGSSSKSRLG
jgi:hypothetical protein